MSFSVFGHPGTRFKVQQMKNGKFLWQIFAWKECIADGFEDTEDAAEKAMVKSAGKVLLKQAKKGKNRSNLYARLKEFCRKRPWLCIFIFDAIVHDMELEVIAEQAQSEEEGRHADAVQKLGIEPLNLHPLAKPARQVAMTIWDTVEALGWDRTRVDRFAKEYLGHAYSNPDAAKPVEFTRLKKKKGGEE